MDVCLFDKTGTITSDRLVAETLIAPRSAELHHPPTTVELARSGGGGGVGNPGDTDEISPCLVRGSKGVLPAEVQRHPALIVTHSYVGSQQVLKTATVGILRRFLQQLHYFRGILKTTPFNWLVVGGRCGVPLPH